MAITRYATKAEAEATGGQVSWVFDDKGNNWEVRTDSDVYEDLTPEVDKWALILACKDAGFTEAQLDDSVATLSANRRLFWKYAARINKESTFATVLKNKITPTPPTANQWKAIFLAASLMSTSTV